jgi:DNA-binding SARP family transcriptional activator
MVGDLARADEYLEASVEVARSAGGIVDEAVFLADLGETRRRLGRLEDAEALLLQSLALHQQLGNSLRLGETTVYLGRLRLDQGRREEARRLFQASLPDLERAHGTRLLSHAFVHLGLLDSLAGDEGRALSSFRSALEHAQSGDHRLARVRALEEIGILQASQVRAESAVGLLSACRAERQRLGIFPEPDVLARLEQAESGLRSALGQTIYEARWNEGLAWPTQDVAARTLVELTPHPRLLAPVEAAGAALEIFAFGDARVVLGGRTLNATEWTYAKSKELLFYLLSRGSATKAQIGLDLWPEASPEQLRSAFHSALHHLRRALGAGDWIRYAGGRYAFNRDRPFIFDVEDFEEHVRRAREATGAGDATGRDRAVLDLTAAERRVGGDFLADLPGADWALFERERLRQARIDALLLLAECHFTDAAYPAAAEAYQHILTLDGYLEIAHRGWMRCLARQGESAQAVRHYQGLVEVLRAELGTTPSPETTLLLERIRRGDDV